MKLKLTGHDYKYAVEQIMLMLFPEERPEYAEPEPGVLSAEISLSTGGAVAVAITRLYTPDGRRFRGEARVSRSKLTDKLTSDRLLQRCVKMSFYKAAVSYTGRHPVWGALTGIRPGKLVTGMLLSGYSEKRAVTEMMTQNFVSPERARLCLDTAKAGLAVKATLQPRDICLYIGIPFCPTRCAYCSCVSNSVEKSMKLVSPVLDTLIKELESDGFDYELTYKAIKAYSSEIQKAAGYKADGDDKKYKQSLETLISSGMDKKTVEKAIDTVEIDEEQDSKDSKLYNKTDLINALNSGDKSVLKTVIDSNIATDISNGKTKAEAEKSIKSSLKNAFKEEYLAADNSKRSKIKTILKSTGYFGDEDFTNWEASSYNTETMVEAFKSNDTKSIRNYVDNRIKAKVANGMTQDNAVFGIRTSITNQYKAKFINGNADEKAKIITIMTKTGLYGNRTDVINYIHKYWLK